MPCLRKYKKVAAQLLVEENHGFRSQGAVLGPSEGEDVHSQVPRGLPQGLPQTDGSVCDAGPIHVQEHAAFVRKAGQSFYFAGLIDSAHLSGLRDGNDAGLHVMRVIDAMIGVTDSFDCKLAVGYGNGKKLASGKFLWSAAFVGIDVRGLAADHRVISVGQRFQAQAIGSGAIENEEDFNIRAKMLLEFLHRGRGVGIVSIAHRMTLVRFADGFQNFGVNPGIVVAGKTAGRFHVRNNVADGGVQTSGTRPRTSAPSVLRGLTSDVRGPTSAMARWWYYSVSTTVILARWVSATMVTTWHSYS